MNGTTQIVTDGVVGLPKSQLLALNGRPGLRIESRGGSVWITQDGDLRDVVLDPGQAHVLDRAGPVIVQALDAAVVAVLPPDRPQARGNNLWQRLLPSSLSA